jgi:hypothetical protein
MKHAIFFFAFLIAEMSTIHGARADEVPLDVYGFSRYVGAAFQRALPGSTVTVDGPLNLKIVVQKDGKDDPHAASLVALHKLCMREAEHCDMFVRQHVTDITSYYAHRDDQLDAKTLRIAVRPSGYVAQARKLWGEKALPARPLAGELWIVGVADLPTAIRMLKPDDLQTLSIDADQALAKAKDNTRLELKKSIADLRRAGTTDHVIGLTGDSYMSSLLAFDDLWADVAKSMDGHLVAMAPGPDVLLVSRDDPDSLAAMKNAAQDVLSKSLHPLSAAVFRWSDKGWVVATP